MNMTIKTAVALTAMSCQLVFCSCQNDSLRVNLVQGVIGDVEINCGSWEENVKPINIGVSGRLDDAVCPLHQTSLEIMRDGNIVKPVGDVEWQVTGERMPVKIRFTIR
jgi:hypothetical protein